MDGPMDCFQSWGSVFFFLCVSMVREMGLGDWEVIKVKTLREGSFIYGTPKVVGPGVEGWTENPMSAH